MDRILDYLIIDMNTYLQDNCYEFGDVDCVEWYIEYQYNDKNNIVLKKQVGDVEFEAIDISDDEDSY